MSRREIIEIHETRDSELLSALNEEIQTIHHHMYPEIFKPYDIDSVKMFFSTLDIGVKCKAFVAYQNEIPLGYVLMMIKDVQENPFQYARKYVELDQILVLEKNKGIGQMPVDKIIEETSSLKIYRIELNHWTMNEVAREFFKRNRFEYVSERMVLKL